MNDQLNNQLKKFTFLMIGIQILSILVIGFCFVIMNIFVKIRLTQVIAHEVRHSLLIGDFRHAVSALENVCDGNFIMIKYFDGSGKVRFSIPTRAQVEASAYYDPFLMSHSEQLLPSASNGNPLGTIEFHFSVVSGIQYALVVSAFLLGGSVPLANVYRRRLTKRYETEVRAQADSAVARMTQMLAHDVRKPFSILRMGLKMLGSATDSKSVSQVLAKLVPEIDKTVTHVDGLIADVMEIGAWHTNLIQEPVAPEDLIASAAADLCRIYPEANLSFSYSWAHQHCVSVHVSKVTRAFSNILYNSAQAMNYDGKIWFRTRETGDGFIEFCLGNSGSFIPPENLPNLFYAFFTSGKKNGTGLGLAIAQKAIQAHGGKIWCASAKTAEYPMGQVEFYFTLPVAKQVFAVHPSRLPTSSQEYRQKFSLNDPKPVILASHPIIDNLPTESAARSVNAKTIVPGLSSKPQVAVVEDDIFMLEAWVNSLQQDSDVYPAASPDEFAVMMKQDPSLIFRLSCVITDLHFHNCQQDGFALARKIKAHRPELTVFMSSDGAVIDRDLAGAIDKVIEKEPKSYRELFG